MQIFTFDPTRYAETYARRGYVHIPQGLTRGFLHSLQIGLEEQLRQKELTKGIAMSEWRYELPDTAHYDKLRSGIGGVIGADPATLVLSERHFKLYEPNAAPQPPAHKDRLSSEVSVGFSIRVAEGSALVLYPDDHLDVNPFNSSREMTESLSLDRSQNVFLQHARRVEIHDQPGDVVMFRGNKIWHLRSNAANTAMLYLKLNSFNCDPLEEDPMTPLRRRRTEQFVGLPDEQLARLIPHIGRRVDYFHKRMSRDWQELNGVVLYGERHFTVDDDEMKGLCAIDGRRKVRTIAKLMGGGPDAYSKLRRLAARGVIELLEDAALLQPTCTCGRHPAATGSQTAPAPAGRT